MVGATKRLAGLKSALEEAAGSRVVASPRAAAVAETARTEKRTASRNGKIHVGAWLPPEFKTSLRMIQIKASGSGTERGFQDLLAEALNDLFAKYDVPVVNQ
jgi:hypothetical protein